MQRGLERQDEGTLPLGMAQAKKAPRRLHHSVYINGFAFS